jgi:predicted SAM-dependent methyltransferase
MLHIAAEPCLLERFKAEFGIRYHTMDLLSNMDIRGDLCVMPFMSASIDIVLTNHVLEHVKDDFAAICEIYRILKPKGIAILQVPIHQKLAVTLEAPKGASPQDLLRLFGQEDHVRMYGNDFRNRFECAGFAVQAHRCGDTVTEDELAAHGLYPGEVVWEAVKS